MPESFLPIYSQLSADLCETIYRQHASLTDGKDAVRHLESKIDDVFREMYEKYGATPSHQDFITFDHDEDQVYVVAARHILSPGTSSDQLHMKVVIDKMDVS